MKTERLRIGGMTCAACRDKIEKKLRAAAGVQSAAVNYGAGTADVTYDGAVTSTRALEAVVEKLGYTVLRGGAEENRTRAAGALVVVAAAYMILRHTGLLDFFGGFQLAEAGMGYGMLFVLGLVTSVHCVAMCGGINLSQSLPASGGGKTAALRPSALYNLGRVVSYTAVGFAVGAAGAVIQFSGAARGAVQLAAGAFMVIMGLNMLGIFPGLRRFAPRLPRALSRRISARKSGGPLVVGLLNGLMPCGPLQAMQIYALSTGSALEGALSMLVFSLGTAPLMFGLGALSSILSRKFTRRVMAVGAALVVVLGLGMLSQGWSLTGLSAGAAGGSEAGVTVENGVQLVSSTLLPGKYPAITVSEGIPVRWVIDAPQGSVNGCNNRLYIPAYDVEYQFKTGENVIEFTPTETGRFAYSCWMGMIRSSITVV